MPLINGMKMACEPCIRGHRSTKCNHANERLMVPVRKPGRPLSSCPHLKDHLCSCNSITAAIPRKQICQCSISTSSKNANVATRATPCSSETPISPGKTSFRIDKSYQKSHLKRKSSGIANLERINSCQLHNHQNPKSANQISIVSSNGYYISQFPNTIGQYSQTSPSLVSQPLRMNGVSQVGESSQYCNGNLDNGHSYSVNQTPLIGPEFFPNGADINIEQSPISDKDLTEIINSVTRSPRKGKTCCDDRKNGYRNENSPTDNRSTGIKVINGNGIVSPIQENSCCMVKCTNQSSTSSTNSFTEQKDSKLTNTCCIETPKALNQNFVSLAEAQSSYPETVDFNHQFYTYPSPQPPVFAYHTATYGSFSNPLNVSTWRQTHDNIFPHIQGQDQVIGNFATVPVPEIRSFVKSCNCGDTCQCVGCVSHPYNDATQDYVRSAWQAITLDGTSSEPYKNGVHTPHEDQSTVSQQNLETKSPSNPPTPSSSNGEEQSLPENNFLFVNYSFPSEGCEGDDFTYECSNNCQHVESDIKRSNPG